MREIKELLEILLKRVVKHGVEGSGLCYAAVNLYYRDDVINDNEVDLIHEYIEYNMPHNVPNSGFAWPKGKLKPRIE